MNFSHVSPSYYRVYPPAATLRLYLERFLCPPCPKYRSHPSERDSHKPRQHTLEISMDESDIHSSFGIWEP